MGVKIEIHGLENEMCRNSYIKVQCDVGKRAVLPCCQNCYFTARGDSAKLICCICKTYLLRLQELFIAFAKIYSVRYLFNLRAVLKAQDRSRVLPMDGNGGGDAQRDTSL